MKFIHLTDTHLVTRGQSLHGLDPYERLEACVRSIVQHHHDAEFLILTGDVADAGDPRAYAAAKDLLERLPIPVHLIPGNHDDRERLLSTFPHTPRDEYGFAQCAFENDLGHFLLLDTLEPPQGSGGAYCEKRCRWLTEHLAQAGGSPVFLFMHHPPFVIGVPTLDRIALAYPEAFTRIVVEAGNVRHLFFGHVHRPVSGSWRGIPFSTLYGTNHQTRLDLVSTDVLAYTAEPPAYGVVLIEETQVVVHTCYYLENMQDIRGRT